MRPAALIAPAALALLTAGCQKQTVEVKPGSGQDIYMAKCAACHGAHGDGFGTMYPPIAGSDWVNGPPERLAAIVLDGMNGPSGKYNSFMPAWRNYMGDAEIAEVVTWLRKSAGKPPYSAVEVNHVRTQTAQRNTFWTVKDLQAYSFH